MGSTPRGEGFSSRAYMFMRSNVIGLIALFIAINGTAIAAPSLKKLSKEVNALEKEVDSLALEAGPQGPQGPQGPPGSGSGGPPSGSAGGALAGTYPNPTLSPSVIAGLKDSCPSDMNKVGNTLCMDKIATSPTSWNGAAYVCAARGLRLPSVAELMLAAFSGFLAPDVAYWAGEQARTPDPNDGGPTDRAMTVFNGTSTGGPHGVQVFQHIERFVACASAPSDGDVGPPIP